MFEKGAKIMEEETIKEICKMQREYFDGMIEANMEGSMATATYYIEFINKLQDLLNE